MQNRCNPAGPVVIIPSPNPPRPRSAPTSKYRLRLQLHTRTPRSVDYNNIRLATTGTPLEASVPSQQSIYQHHPWPPYVPAYEKPRRPRPFVFAVLLAEIVGKSTEHKTSATPPTPANGVLRKTSIHPPLHTHQRDRLSPLSRQCLCAPKIPY